MYIVSYYCHCSSWPLSLTTLRQIGICIHTHPRQGRELYPCIFKKNQWLSLILPVQSSSLDTHTKSSLCTNLLGFVCIMQFLQLAVVFGPDRLAQRRERERKIYVRCGGGGGACTHTHHYCNKFTQENNWTMFPYFIWCFMEYDV